MPMKSDKRKLDRPGRKGIGPYNFKLISFVHVKHFFKTYEAFRESIPFNT